MSSDRSFHSEIVELSNIGQQYPKGSSSIVDPAGVAQPVELGDDTREIPLATMQQILDS